MRPNTLHFALFDTTAPLLPLLLSLVPSSTQVSITCIFVLLFMKQQRIFHLSGISKHFQLLWPCACLSPRISGSRSNVEHHLVLIMYHPRENKSFISINLATFIRTIHHFTRFRSARCEARRHFIKVIFRSVEMFRLNT